MTKRKPKKAQKRTNRSSGAVRARDPLPWKYCLLTLVCGAFLVVGFFGAARQHFASIDFGIKNSKLRKQIQDLEAEQKRLILAREVALSPFEIKKAAKKFGVFDQSDGFDQTISAVKISDKKTDSNKAEDKTSDKKTKKEEKPKGEDTFSKEKKSGDKKVPEKKAGDNKKKSPDKNAPEKKSDKSKDNGKDIKRSRRVDTKD